MMQRPEIKELSNIQIFKPQSTTLDNGIDMKSISIGDQPVSRLDIIFEGGRCDGRNQTVSEMLSAILREGTTSLNAQEIAEALDYHGAWLGCDASSHNATLSLYSLNRNFEKVVPILADIVMNPSFPEQELSNLKSLAANRLRINRQKVAFLAMETFARLHFGEGSNLGKVVSENDIESITTEELSKFHKQWFAPQNMSVILSGKVEGQMFDVVNNCFGKTPVTGAPQQSATDSPSIKFKPDTVVVDKPDALQSAVRMGMPTVLRSDADYIPLRILVTALGGYFGSRLMTNIREDKGYTYGISASLLGYRNNSFISISCQCDTSHTWQVAKEIKTEIEKLQNDTIPKVEVVYDKRPGTHPRHAILNRRLLRVAPQQPHQHRLFRAAAGYNQLHFRLQPSRHSATPAVIGRDANCCCRQCQRIVKPQELTKAGQTPTASALPLIFNNCNYFFSDFTIS